MRGIVEDVVYYTLAFPTGHDGKVSRQTDRQTDRRKEFCFVLGVLLSTNSSS